MDFTQPPQYINISSKSRFKKGHFCTLAKLFFKSQIDRIFIDSGIAEPIATANLIQIIKVFEGRKRRIHKIGKLESKCQTLVPQVLTVINILPEPNLKVF